MNERPRHHSAGDSIFAGAIFFRFAFYNAVSPSVIEKVDIRHLTAENSVIGGTDFTIFACMYSSAEQAGAALSDVVAFGVCMNHVTLKQAGRTAAGVVALGVEMYHTAIGASGHRTTGIVAMLIEMDLVAEQAVYGRVFLAFMAAEQGRSGLLVELPCAARIAVFFYNATDDADQSDHTD